MLLSFERSRRRNVFRAYLFFLSQNSDKSCMVHLDAEVLQPLPETSLLLKALLAWVRVGVPGHDRTSGDGSGIPCAYKTLI